MQTSHSQHNEIWQPHTKHLFNFSTMQLSFSFSLSLYTTHSLSLYREFHYKTLYMLLGTNTEFHLDVCGEWVMCFNDAQLFC